VRTPRSPFVKKEVVSVLRGTICFPFGQAFACVKSSYRLTTGETHALKESIAIHMGQIGLETSHKISEEVSSNMPVGRAGVRSRSPGGHRGLGS
jgi:hypothetical protein